MVLAELMWWAYGLLTMYDLYKMWISLPIFSFRRKHSESQSEQAVFTRNAKMLRKAETGYYGLNSGTRRL